MLVYIEDPTHTSYQVRNQLMSVAPKVSYDAWTAAFERAVPMNPWHLAQALIANSPLQSEVLDLMSTSGLDAYYRNLVNNAQTGAGISMLTIYEAEQALWYGRKTAALHNLTAKALHSGDPQAMANVLALHTDYAVHTSPISLTALHMAAGDLVAARDVVDDAIMVPTLTDYFKVQDLYLTLLENNQTLMDIDALGISTLESFAAERSLASGAAKAWLTQLGRPLVEDIVLPAPDRSPDAEDRISIVSAAVGVRAYPNPSNGPVYLVVQLPEGTEAGSVRVLDPLGRLVVEKTFTGDVSIVDLDGTGLANGVYAAAAYADGIAIGTTKFEVVE